MSSKKSKEGFEFNAAEAGVITSAELSKHERALDLLQMQNELTDRLLESQKLFEEIDVADSPFGKKALNYFRDALTEVSDSLQETFVSARNKEEGAAFADLQKEAIAKKDRLADEVFFSGDEEKKARQLIGQAARLEEVRPKKRFSFFTKEGRKAKQEAANLLADADMTIAANKRRQSTRDEAAKRLAASLDKEKLKTIAGHFNLSWDDITEKLLPEVQEKILNEFSKRGLSIPDFDVVLTPAIVSNLQMTLNHPENALTSTSEWTSTCLLNQIGTDSGSRLLVGYSENGGAGYVDDAHRVDRWGDRGFRLSVVFGPHP